MTDCLESGHSTPLSSCADPVGAASEALVASIDQDDSGPALKQDQPDVLKSIEEDNIAPVAEDVETSPDSDVTIAQIEALGHRIRLTDEDSDTKLKLWCYVGLNQEDKGDILKCRGVVFNDDKVVLHAYPHQVEICGTDVPEIQAAIADNIAECEFFDSYEGALIRMFCHEGRWYMCTNRKLDAFRSKWACRDSFGTIFKKSIAAEVERNEPLRNSLPDGDSVLSRFQGILNPENEYYFLVCNTEENRIVCLAPESPHFFHVGTYADGRFMLKDELHIPRPEARTFSSVNELCDTVNDMDPRFFQGVMVFGPDGLHLKICSKEYNDLALARGNEPSIRFRYLQVRLDDKHTRMLQYLYPKQSELMDNLENSIYDIAKSIYRSYVHRFIKKRFVSVPKEEFAVIRTCHAWHEENRPENRMTFEKVIQVLNEQTATALNHMIRRHEQDLNKKDDNNETLVTKRRTDTQRTLAPQNEPSDVCLSPLNLGSADV